MTQTRSLIDENGIRTDGRTGNQLRDIQIKVGVVKNADGSALIEFGKNKIIAAVYGPREVHPKHMALTDRCLLRCRYHMSPFSTDTRKNPAPSRREVEISKVIREALQPALMLEDYPRATIDVYIEVLQADGGSRCAGIAAASVALASQGSALHETKHYQQNRSENSRGFIRRQQTDHRSRCAHDDQRCDENEAATKMFAEIATNHAADRAGEIAHGERG